MPPALTSRASPVATLPSSQRRTTETRTLPRWNLRWTRTASVVARFKEELPLGRSPAPLVSSASRRRSKTALVNRRRRLGSASRRMHPYTRAALFGEGAQRIDEFLDCCGALVQSRLLLGG